MDLVSKIRQNQPRVGVRKLYNMLYEELHNLPSIISRDKLFLLLGRHDMLIHHKRCYISTTDSEHEQTIYPNLLKSLSSISEVDHVLISDLTYLRLRGGFCYLFLAAELRSRKILGYQLSNNLLAKWPTLVLKESLKSISDVSSKKIIHHSDRGFQYSSRSYIKELEKNRISVSMSAKGNPYDNAVMERIIGILKQEFMLNGNFQDAVQVNKAVKEAIDIYNNERIHYSLNMKTPSAVFDEYGYKKVA